jgi:hypothetical protein
MDNFDIILEFKPLTAKQLTQEKYLILQKMVKKDSEYFRLALLRILDDKLDFSGIDSKECLLIRFSRFGKHKIDYSSIKDKRIRSHVKRVIDSSYPIIC